MSNTATRPEGPHQGILLNCLRFVPALLVFSWALYLYPVFDDLRYTGYPYEDWDEVSGYNTSFVLTGDHTTRAHFYGTLDLAKFIAADFYYTKFDPVGRTLWRNNFTNAVPESLTDHRVFYGPNYWKPQGRSSIDYVYFRGIQDRMPIFIARLLSAITCLALLVFAGIYFNASLGAASLAVLVPLAFFFTPMAYTEQFWNALPNAFNGVALSIIFLLLACFIIRQDRRSLLVASGLFAIACNTKFDAVGYAVPFLLAVAFGHFAQRASLRVFLKSCAACLLTFLPVLIVTNPYLWFDPSKQVLMKWKLLQAAGVGAPPIAKNFGIFSQFIDAVFCKGYFGRTYSSGLLSVAPAIIFAAALLGIAGAFLLAPQLSRRTRWALAGTTLAFAALGCLAPVLGANVLYGRYFVPAIGLLAAMIGALALVYQLAGTWKHRLSSACLCLPFLWLTITNVKNLQYIRHAGAADRAAHGGLSPNHSRDLATLAILERAARDPAPPVVLVDQHSYTDLRPFLARGLDVRYINMFNVQDILRALHPPAAKALVLYTRGDPDATPAWVGAWTVEEKALYESYLARLDAFGGRQTFGTKKMALLDWAPVLTNDEINVVSIGAALP